MPVQKFQKDDFRVVFVFKIQFFRTQFSENRMNQFRENGDEIT